MEQPSAKEHLLDWYVNKLYKKAVDHCLQQEKTSVAILGQGHKGHYQGHHQSIDKKQVCKSSVNGGLSKCARPSSKNPQSSVNVYRSDIDDEVFNSEKHFHENTDKFVKQPTSYPRHVMNIVLSERRNTLNMNVSDCEPEVFVKGNYHIGRQHLTKTFHQDSLERNITPPINTSDGPYRQRDCQKDSRISKPSVSHVATHQPHSHCQTDCKRNGSFGIHENEFPTQRQGQKDWFSHSALPHRTNVLINQQLFSKDDSDICHKDESNLKAYSEHSVRIAWGSNGAPCQSVKSVSKEKRCLDGVCPKWESRKMETEKKCLDGVRPQWESKKMERRWSERTCPRDIMNTQFHQSAVSKDRSVMKNSLEARGAQNSKAVSLFITKSNNHCSSSDAKKGRHMVNLNSEDCCNKRVQPCAGVLEKEGNLLVPYETTKTAIEPEPLPVQSPTDDNCLESPETEDKTEIHSTENKTSKSPVASPISSSTVEASESPVHPKRCNVSPATITEPEVLPLTGENLRQLNKASIQERGDHSLPGLDNRASDQDEGAETDSGGSCKSGIVIKHGHIKQKRKRSRSVQDENSCKRRSSEANNDKSSNSQSSGKCVNNSVKGSRRATVNKNKPKSGKSDKTGKSVEAANSKVKTKRNTKHVYKNVKDNDASKKTVKTKNLFLETFDVTKKRIQQTMSENVKRCVEREISILQAHEDQAMSTNSESCGHLSDSDRMSSLAFLDLKDLAHVPEPGKLLENQSVYVSKKHVGGVWQSIVKK